MWGAIIGAGMSTLGSIIGGAQQRKAARKALEEKLNGIRDQRLQAAQSYNYDMGVPRYAANQVLNQMGEKMRQRAEARRGTQKVVGGTEASVQAGNETDAEALANTTQNAVAQGMEQRKAIRQQYDQTMRNLTQQEAEARSGFNQAQANATSQATAGVINTAGSIAGAIDGGSKGQKASSTVTQKETATAGAGKVETPAPGGGMSEEYKQGKLNALDEYNNKTIM